MGLSGAIGLIVGIAFEAFLIYTIVRAFIRQYPGWGWFMIAFFPVIAITAALAPEDAGLGFIILISVLLLGLLVVTIYTFVISVLPAVEDEECPQCQGKAIALRYIKMDADTEKKVETKISGWVLIALGVVIALAMVIMILAWGFSAAFGVMIVIGLSLSGKGLTILQNRPQKIVEAVLFKCKSCKHKFNLELAEEDDLVESIA